MSNTSKVLNQAQIRELVSQIKAGEKDKSTAFQELRGLLKQQSLRGGDSNNDSESGLAQPNPSIPSISIENNIQNQIPNNVSSSFDGNNENGVKISEYTLSQDDRRLIISRLLEKRRLDRIKRSAMANAEDDDDVSSIESEGDSVQRNDLLSVNFDESRNSGLKSLKKKTPRSTSRKRPHSAGSRRSSSALAMSTRNLTRSVDDSAIRMNRIYRSEDALMREAYKEYTFKPHVPKLPEMYGFKSQYSNVPFYDRVMRWHRERELDIDRKRNSVEKSEDIECFFHPKINRNSERAARDMRKYENMDIVERLYKSSEAASVLRQKFVEEELRRERMAEDLECTFHPKVLNKNKFQTVKSRFDQSVSRLQNDGDAGRPEECTFVPQIKGVAPHMVSAKMYISTNVVDRLTRPIVAPPSPDDPMRAFDSSFRGIAGGLAGGDGGSRGGSPHRVMLSKEELQRREMSFQEFIARQSQTDMKRRAHLEEGKKKAVINLVKPNKKSLEILEKEKKGDFFERLNSTLVKRQIEIQNITNGTIPHYDTDCTFQPKLTDKAKAMRPRSSYEMSRGDLLKKDTNQRMRRLKNEQEELEALTFQPQISDLAKRLNHSHLQLIDDSKGFIQRYQRECKEREEQLLKYKHELALRESDECTFSPETKECPAYIRRIAKSLEIVKASRPPEKKAPTRPQWV